MSGRVFCSCSDPDFRYISNKTHKLKKDITPEEKGDHKENCFKRFLFSTHNALLPNNALCDDDILLQGKYGLEKKFISITRIFPQKFENNLYFVSFALQLRQ